MEAPARLQLLDPALHRLILAGSVPLSALVASPSALRYVTGQAWGMMSDRPYRASVYFLVALLEVGMLLVAGIVILQPTLCCDMSFIKQQKEAMPQWLKLLLWSDDAINASKTVPGGAIRWLILYLQSDNAINASKTPPGGATRWLIPHQWSDNASTASKTLPGGAIRWPCRG